MELEVSWLAVGGAVVRRSFYHPGTVRNDTEKYYADLQADYSIKIRQLVPKYDEMVDCITGLLVLRQPKSLLDIGAGIGNVSQLVLYRMPGVRITAVEAHDQMAAEARRRLAAAGDRVEIVESDILDFAPADRFDAIFTNLVLHNLPPAGRRRLLKDLRDWLSPDGWFIWGDMIRHADARVQSHFVKYRAEHALTAGCSADLVEWNFRKESEDDNPLTVEETLEACREAGFSNRSVVWAHDTFAVLLLLTGSG